MEIIQHDQKCRYTSWLLFFGVVGAVISGAGDVGLTWDETLATFRGSEVFREWLFVVREKIFSGKWDWLWDPAFVYTYWPPTTQENQAGYSFNYHPPLTRYLPTITWFVFNGWFGDTIAYRMSPAIVFALAVVVLFRFMSKEFDYSTGLFSAVSLVLMPRVFGHAHLAATDITMLSLWLFSVLAFYKGLEDRRWSYGFAVLLGLAFSVKFTGVMIPLALLLYMACAREKRAWRNVMVSAIIAPLILMLLNPTWWMNPVSGMIDNYILPALTRNQFTPFHIYYLGESYNANGPWHISLVMTAATIPTVIFAFAVTGGVAGVRRWREKPILLILSQLAFYYAILILPLSPDYDGVRLYLPVFPFIACLAGLGFRELREALVQRWHRAPKFLESLGEKKRVVLIFIFTFAVPALQLILIHPYYLEYYNGMVGGISGANRKGFETTYWLDTVTSSAREEINKLPAQSRIMIFPPDAKPYLSFLKDRGVIKKELIVDRIDWEYMIMVPRQSHFNEDTWLVYRNVNPIYQNSLDGVPMFMIYSRE